MKDKIANEVSNEVRKQLIAQQRVHWAQMGRPDFDFGNLNEVIEHIANFYNIAGSLIGVSDERDEIDWEKARDVFLED